MKRTVSVWQMGGFIFTAVSGTLLHFLFDWTGGNGFAALFSAVNESIWEHLKLLVYPALVFAIVEYFSWGRKTDSFWCVKLLGSLTGMLLIPVVYYTVSGIFGTPPDRFNITLFFAAAGFVYRMETQLFRRNCLCTAGKTACLIILAVVVLAFSVFTFLPPEIPIFQDPVTGTYGFWRNG